jgi:hypothetical protein
VSDFYNEATPIAKKDRKCSLCGRSIPKGAKYKKLTGKFEGDFFSSSLHFNCLKIIEDYGNDLKETSWDRESVIYWAREKACADSGCTKYVDCTIFVLDCVLAREILWR